MCYLTRAVLPAILAVTVIASVPAATVKDSARPAVLVAVVIFAEQEFSPVSLAVMKRELESIIQSCGVRIQWSMRNGSSNSEVFETGNFEVARFKGTCGRDFGDAELQRRVLGLTHLSDGEIQPFAEVDCDRVRAAILPRLKPERVAALEHFVGRALGRVLAHELYHILANTNRHAQKGVGKEELRLWNWWRGGLNLNQRSPRRYGRR